MLPHGKKDLHSLPLRMPIWNFLPKALDGSEKLEDAMKHADEQANTDINNKWG